MESLENSLGTNFEQNVMDYYYSIYNNSNLITYKKDYVYNKNTLMCEVANEQNEIDYEKLKECYYNILDFINIIDFKEYPIKYISVEITNNTGHVKWLSLYSDNKIKSFDEFKNSD